MDADDNQDEDNAIDVSNDDDNISNDDDDGSINANNEDKGSLRTVTRSGRKSYAPKYLLYQKDNEDEVANTVFIESKMNNYNTLKEMNGFDNDEVVTMAGSIKKT